MGVLGNIFDKAAEGITEAAPAITTPTYAAHYAGPSGMTNG